MMKLFSLALWQLIVATAIAEYHAFSNISRDQLVTNSRYKRMNPIETFILKVKINGVSKIINLVATNQLLANENLPVWISLYGHDKEYRRLNNLMKRDVGKFTMFHDYITKSAVIYFHKRDELDGVIDMQYKIEGLPLERLNEEHVLGSSYLRYLNVRQYIHSSCQFRKDLMPTVDGKCEISELKLYPELLVAISHDMVQALEERSKFPVGVKTVSHVLTVYNAVDMLYKYVKSADISINIAGIVIENTENQWGFQSEKFGKFYRYIEAGSVNKKISAYFRKREHYFRRHSYDYVAYHSRKRIFEDNGEPVEGISLPAGLKPMFNPQRYRYRFNLVARDLNSYDHYSTIAHELAHVFGADHDCERNSFLAHPCDRSIMAEYSCPRLCLKWSDTTEEEMKKFFSSPAHCVLINEPQSLLPNTPRRIISAARQCQCYGYESPYEVADSSGDKCSTDLRCSDKEGKVSTYLPYPMDGTPCSEDLIQVCWIEQCTRISEN